MVTIQLLRTPLSQLDISNITNIFEALIHRVSPNGEIAQKLKKLYRKSPLFQSNILPPEDDLFSPIECNPSDWKETMDIFQQILKDDVLNLSAAPKMSRKAWMSWILNDEIPESI